MSKLKLYFGQLSTILGSSGVIYAVVQFLTHQWDWQQTVAALAGSVVLILMQEAKYGNSDTQSTIAKDVEKVVSDALTTNNQK